MKKIISIILIIVLLFAFCGCDASKNPSLPTEATSDGMQSAFKDNYTPSAFKIELNNRNILPNENLEDKNDELTSDDIRYHFNEAVNALTQLDLETLKNYVSEEEFKIYENIKNNKAVYNLWVRTIGNISFLPESNLFVGRFPSITYYIWYNDNFEKGNTIKPSYKYTQKELKEIYDAYYEKTPITIAGCNTEDYLIENGQIHFTLTDIFYSIGVSSLIYFNEDNNEFNNCCELLLSWESTESELSDYNKIKEDNFVLYDALLNKNIDEAIKTIDENDTFFNEDYIKEEYIKYLKDDKNKQIIQDYIIQKTNNYRGFNNILITHKIDTSKHFGIYTDLLSNKEKDTLKDIEIYDTTYAQKSPSNDLQWQSSYGEIINIINNYNILS